MKRMEPLNRDELLGLLTAARKSSTRDWCLLLLMYQHGLRASEVGSLRRADLNERDWTLSINRLKGRRRPCKLSIRTASNCWTPEKLLPNGCKSALPEPPTCSRIHETAL